MKLQQLNRDAVQLCERAYRHRKESFQNKEYEKLYLDFCKETNYEDIDPKNFEAYVGVYGKMTHGGKVFGSINRNSGTVVHTRTTMLKSSDGKAVSVAEYALNNCSRIINNGGAL
jgi:hypothetical protein